MYIYTINTFVLVIKVIGHESLKCLESYSYDSNNLFYLLHCNCVSVIIASRVFLRDDVGTHVNRLRKLAQITVSLKIIYIFNLPET